MLGRRAMVLAVMVEVNMSRPLTRSTASVKTQELQVVKKEEGGIARGETGRKSTICRAPLVSVVKQQHGVAASSLSE